MQYEWVTDTSIIRHRGSSVTSFKEVVEKSFTAEIGEPLDPCDKLRVQWGNQAEILFAGWTDIKFVK